MKKLSFPLFADACFYGLCAFLLAAGILRYEGMPLAPALLVSLFLALAAAGLIFLLLYLSRRKKLFTKREKEERDALLLHLALEREEKVRALFESIFEKNRRYLFCFTMQPLSADEIARTLRSEGGGEFTLFCNALTVEAQELALSFGVTLVKGDETYRLLKKNNLIPEKMILKQAPKKSVRRTLRRALHKQNACPFFVSGALLLIMSLFAFFPRYYLITGGALLLCAVLVRLFGISQKTP